MKKFLVLAVAAIGFTANESAMANLVTNGSFETFTGTFGSDGGAQLTSSSTALTGWTIEGGEVAVLTTTNSYYLTAADGVNFMDLTGYSNSGFPKGLTQNLSGLITGQTYAFSMELGVRNGPCVSGGNNCQGPVQASAGIGGTSQTFTYNSSVMGNNWGTVGFNFVATSPTETLTINGQSVPISNEFLGLDNVSVTPAAVPLPAAGWLLLSGLSGLGLMKRRKAS
jgi:hypothetical protein